MGLGDRVTADEMQIPMPRPLALTESRNMDFFSCLTPDRWILLPTVTIGLMRDGDGEVGPVIVSFDWLCFAVGVAIHPSL
jgi:hypothetical protein